ncbi:MAG: hypothetical protein AB1679_16340 [Actinomycetota bacterium]
MIASLIPFSTRLRRRLTAAVAVAVTAFLPIVAPGAPAAQAADASAGTAGGGYWMVASDGGIFSFGTAKFFGSTGNINLNQPIVGIAATPSGNGYWMVATDGGIFAFGDAKFFGSTGNIKLNRPIVGMAATPSGNGYWLVASDGGIFAFGDARFFGSTGAMKLNKPIVGMAATRSGNGYWFVASDGGIFAFGDARFFGSTGNTKLARPIAAMAATPSGHGYWFISSDGGVFAYGDANFFGARPQPDRNVVAMVPTSDGVGYWQASTTGELLAFGGAADLGGLTKAPNRPIVGMTAAPASTTGVADALPGGAVESPKNPTTTTGGTTMTTKPTATTTPPTTTAPTPTTTPTTTTTTATTQPPYSGPTRFSSTALVSWGTPTDPNKSFVNSSGETMYPYSQKVSAIVEVGNRVYVGGEFTDLVKDDRDRTPSGRPLAYLAELDTDGIPVPGSAFNATVKLDGPVRALHRSPDGRRLYVGGEFNRVNGEIRRRLVALDTATGHIDRTFNPPEPSGYVASITQSGWRVYIAGGFSRLGTTNQPQLAALDAATGALDPGFTPPPRYPGRFEGHTGKRNDNPTTSGDPTGVITSLLVTPDNKYLMVGGSFLHFGYDHDADPDHKHSGLIALDPVTGRLTAWQPEQSPNSSRPIFGMTAYPGDPRTIGINASVLIFTASGGAGGRVIAWVPGGKTTQLWRGNMDGDVMGVAATRDRVYVVGHYDHTVPDPNDPCLDIRELSPGHFGVSCPDGTPSRHLAAFYASGEIVNGKNTGKSIIDTSFTAQADTSEGPYVVVLGANRMYVGGNFSKVASTPVATGGKRVKQPGFAAYPPAS